MCSSDLNSFVAVNSLPSRVAKVANIGQALDSEHPVIQLQVDSNFIGVKVDALEAAKLTVGQILSANVGGQMTDVKIDSIGDFVPASADEPGGSEIRLRPTAEGMEMLAGTQTTVFGEGANEKSIAVPLTAIRDDAAGTFVLRPATAPQIPKRVAVVVIRSGGGWAAIQEGTLNVGDELQVSP